MPEARALKTFKGRYGLIRRGTVFQCDPGYLQSLKKNGLAAEESPQPGPKKDRSVPKAPRPGEKKDPPGKKSGSARALGSGKTLTSASLPAGRASPKKTSEKSAAGGKMKDQTPPGA